MNAAKRKKQKNKHDPPRNPFVVPMRARTGNGVHKDKRKETNKKACRNNFNDLNHTDQ